MNIYSVSQINNYLKNLFTNDVLLRDLYISAEISNFKAHSSGHFYLTLKDSDAAINAVMFRTNAANIKFVPENGMNVLVGGYISVYEKTGQYQFYINSMEPAGKGALYLAYEQLKARLDKSGVFDTKHKKPIPQYPKCVAVITSPTGAAVRDIINVANRRNPNVEIVVVPTLVQGENASSDIVKSIKMVNRWNRADTIILGRGGGSIEDLWAFNEEIVARAIFESNIPIISAVGHETDFTISDFISDLRAPTPSAAAELAVPENKTLNNNIIDYRNRLNNRIQFILSNYNYKYYSLVSSAKFSNYYDSICDNQIYIEDLYNKINKSFQNMLDLKKLKISNMTNNIENNSPLNILKKGYSLAYKEDKVIKSVKDVNADDIINIRVTDGSINAKVLK